MAGVLQQPVTNVRAVREGFRDSQATILNGGASAARTIVPVVPEGTVRLVHWIHGWNDDDVQHTFFTRIIKDDLLVAIPYNLPPLAITAGQGEALPTYLHDPIAIPLIVGDSMNCLYSTAKSLRDPVIFASWIDQT